MMYIILAAGILSILISLLVRKKSSTVSAVFQFIAVAALIAAGIYYYTVTPQYNGLIEALSEQFG